jgi:peptide deformylase
VVVNPKIEESSDEVEEDTEGCLSIPEVRVEVERPAAVTVSGQDLTARRSGSRRRAFWPAPSNTR